jgi:class 3 adenylate cyclase/PAS domain-containing protein
LLRDQLLPGFLLNAHPVAGTPFVVNDIYTMYNTISGVLNQIRLQDEEHHLVGLAGASDDLVEWYVKPLSSPIIQELTALDRYLMMSVEGQLAYTATETVRLLVMVDASFPTLAQAEYNWFSSSGNSSSGSFAGWVPPGMVPFIGYVSVVGTVLPWSSDMLNGAMVIQLLYADELYTDRSIGPLMTYLDELTNSGVSQTLIPVIICTVIIVVSGLMLVPAFMRLGEGAVWSLRLLLFCPPSVVLQTVPIQKVLSNDFTGLGDREDDGGKFFESVVSHLLDAVLFLSTDMKVVSANRAVEAVLGIQPDKVIGEPLQGLFQAVNDSTSVAAFLSMVSGAMNCQRSPSIEAVVEVQRGDIVATLRIQMIAISWSGYVQTHATNREGLAIVAMLIRDVTSAVASNKLLREEGVKSENLLLMILPPIIVKKLQSGEKNISFSVKSASILFLDIVSFTPWCGSHEAAYVMGTLNRMFLEFDRLIKQYDRLTKIKCIGDCYMCAGGLFDEVNQPQIHAQQMISFGLDMIHALQLLNIDLSETLRMRVGVNTGGPIVAGVLGIDKPTFDILGPAICLAAAMEHHGVPMCVHIPQHCYDLVYCLNFVIQERGNVEVKGKTYHTYLVSGYKQD